MGNNYSKKIQKTIYTSNDYDFLKDKFKDNLMILTLGGSYAYGLNNENSDIDIRGVAHNSYYDLLTMNNTDKPFVETKTDTTIYYFKQIINLLLNCNPNVLEIFGTREEDIFVLSNEGKILRDNINLFLSQRAIHSFCGYATAQLRRLQNALARDSYPQKEKEKHILDSINHQREHIERNYHCFDGKDINLFLDKSNKTDFDEEIFLNLNLKHYPLRDLLSILSEWKNVIKDYDSLNHRNNKKDDIHLNKHVMHIIRLMRMGKEILEGKGVITNRAHEHEFMMALRNGDYVINKDNNKDYSEIFNMIDKAEKDLKFSIKHTELPLKPDENKINELVIEINKNILKKAGIV
jgi:predicted nucleotidyltransferase